jgi:hypothetical protein
MPVTGSEADFLSFLRRGTLHRNIQVADHRPALLNLRVNDAVGVIRIMVKEDEVPRVAFRAEPDSFLPGRVPPSLF